MRAVLIGGGDFGVADGKPHNLENIHKKIFQMTAKPHPRILFVGFSERANYIFGAFKKIFMPLGAMCEYLKHTELENMRSVESKFKRADVVYIGGGNSIEFMRQIRKFGLDEKIVEAAGRGAILAGISAGAICYSSLGMSDAGNADAKKFIAAEGLGLIDILFCPHYSTSARKEALPDFLKDVDKPAICLDDQVALIVDGDKFSVLKDNEVAGAYCCRNLGHRFLCEEITHGKLDDILIL